MSTIRIEKTENFTTIHNFGIKDNRLSWGATGLLVYLLHLPNNWVIRLEHLKKVKKDKRASTDSKLKELINAGYLIQGKRERINGKLAGYNYTLYEYPKDKELNEENILQNQQPNSNSLQSEINSRKPTVENQLLLNTNILKTNNKKINVSKETIHFLIKIKEIGKFNTVLPIRNNKLTKTVKRIINFIDDLKNNSLSKEYVWDSKWIKRNNIDFNSSLFQNQDYVRKVILKAARRYSRMQKQGYWPEKKETLTKNMADWFYNSHTKKSWFLYCYSNKPKEIKNIREQDQIEPIKKSIPDKELKVLSEYEKRYSEESVLSFWKKSKELYDWHKSVKRDLQKYHTYQDGNWGGECGAFGDLIQRIQEFSESWGGWNIGNYGYGNKTWYLFVAWMKEERGIVLFPSNRDLVKTLERYERDRGK